MDIALRLFPIIPLYYRNFELLNQPNEIFKHTQSLRPNTTNTLDSHGDLGAMLGNSDYQIKRSIIFTTDTLGFRNQPGQHIQNNKIILLGDSYVMGSGVDQGQMTSFLLNEQGINTYNLGFPGGIDKSVQRYLQFKPMIKTDEDFKVYFILFEGNDWDENCYPLDIEPRLTSWELIQNKMTSFRKRSPIRQLYTRLLYTDYDPNKKKLVEIDNERTSNLLFLPYLEQDSLKYQDLDRYACFKASIEKLNNQVRKDGGELIVLSVFSKESYINSVQFHPFDETFKTIASELNIDFISTRELFDPKNDTKYCWWLDDTHWNNHGHEKLFNIITNGYK